MKRFLSSSIALALVALSIFFTGCTKDAPEDVTTTTENITTTVENITTTAESSINVTEKKPETTKAVSKARTVKVSMGSIFTFDEKGNLVSHERPAEASDFQIIYYYYDKLGNCTEISCVGDKETDAVIMTTFFEYDNDNRCIKQNNYWVDGIDYNLSESFTYEYNDLGQISRINVNDPENPQLSGYNEYTYNEACQLTCDKSFNADGTLDYQINYTYDGVKLTKAENSKGSFQIFEYDKSGRLIKETDEYGFSEYVYSDGGNTVYVYFNGIKNDPDCKTTIKYYENKTIAEYGLPTPGFTPDSDEYSLYLNAPKTTSKNITDPTKIL